MLTNSENWGPDLPQLCKQILEGVVTEEDKYQVGLTKIFFRAGMLANLERVRSNRLRSLVVLMQKNFLRTLHQRKYANLKRATIGLQSQWRKILAQRHVEQIKQETAALVLQRVLRGHLERSRFLRSRSAAISIQRGMPLLCESLQNYKLLNFCNFQLYVAIWSVKPQATSNNATLPSSCRLLFEACT